MISPDAPMEGPTFFEAVVVEQATLGLAPYGLSLARSTPTLVRFASADVFVEFFLDPRSLEVGAEIGLRPEVDYREGARREGESFSIGRPTIRNAFSLEQILKYYRDDQSDTDTVGSFTLENIAKLPAAFSELLKSLLEHAAPFLRGDFSAFVLLGDRLSLAAQAFTKSMQEEDLRIAAERAWQARDYARVASLLSKRESHLSDAEEAKLKYALRQLGAGRS